jgi:hypothetical protein
VSPRAELAADLEESLSIIVMARLSSFLEGF